MRGRSWRSVVLFCVRLWIFGLIRVSSLSLVISLRILRMWVVFFFFGESRRKGRNFFLRELRFMIKIFVLAYWIINFFFWKSESLKWVGYVRG